MAIFSTKKCSNGHELKDPRQLYCQECGVPVGGGNIQCGICGTKNQVTSKYCNKCGQPVSQIAAPTIDRDRWLVTNEEFATRIEPQDLSGILKRGLYVEAGTNAMILESGANIGVVPPGSYVLDTFMDKLKGWFSSDLPKRATALLVKVTPTDLSYRIDQLFSKDPLRVAVDLVLQVEVEEPGKFLVNMMGSRERFSVQALKDYLFFEIHSFTSMWVKQYSVDELSEDPSLREKYELALTEELKVTLNQTGLKILQVRAINFILEIVDQLSGQKQDYIIQASKEKVKLEGEKTLQEAKNEHNLLEIIRLTHEVEHDERKNIVFARMRDAANSNRMDHIRSEQEFKDFQKRLDRENVLDEKEYSRFERTWKEADEDHETARELFKKKIEIENEYHKTILFMKKKHEIDREKQDADFEITSTDLTNQSIQESIKLENEIALAEKTRDHYIESERELLLGRLANERERDKLDKERADLKRENYVLNEQAKRGEIQQDAEMALKILENMKAIKRLDLEEEKRILREDELQRERDRFDRERERNATQRAYELEKLDRRMKMNIEQLISISDGKAADQLTALAQAHVYKGMTEEQILAMDPATAEVLKEKYSADRETEVARLQYETMKERLEDHQAWNKKMEEMSDRRVQDLKDQADRSQMTIEKAIENTADAAKAIAQKPDGSTVVIPGAGMGMMGGAVVSGPGGVQSTGMKECQSCGRQTTLDSRFCIGCGTKFADIA